MHFLAGEDADRSRLLLRPRVAGSDAVALEGDEVADFVGDRVLGHRREGAEDADGPGVARPSILNMWSTKASVWRRRNSLSDQSFSAMPSIWDATRLIL